MNNFISYTIALLFALLVHAGVIAMMAVNWKDSTIDISEIKPYYIEATVVAENPYTAEKKKALDKKKQAIQDKLNNRRKVEADLRKSQSQWEKEQAKRKPEIVPEPVVAIAEPVVTPEVKEEINEDEARSSFEEALSLALIEEENLRKAVTDDEKAMAYVAQIQREIIRNWSRPPSARNGMEAMLTVSLVPTGEVVDVNVVESSGNDAFDRSALLAVRKAGRFEVPGDARRFERDFREFTVIFRPDDLRL